MKVETTPTGPVPRETPDPRESGAAVDSEKKTPIEPRADSTVIEGIDYLIRKNASLYRRLAE